MKKLVVVLVLTVVSLALVFGFVEEAEKENAAIKQAALDYIEGWYEGSVERMDKALHPDLNKKGVQVIPSPGEEGVGEAVSLQEGQDDPAGGQGGRASESGIFQIHPLSQTVLHTVTVPLIGSRGQDER